MAGKKKVKKKATAARKPARRKTARKTAARKPARRKAAKKAAAAPAARKARSKKPSREIQRLLSLMELMDTHGFVELEVGADGAVRLCKGGTGAAALAPSTLPVATPAGANEPVAPADADPDLTPFPSPMVGTFYRAPSPEAEMYVKEGDSVGPDSTLCIIEAMKVFNEIKAESSGRIAEILVDNGEAVEYGQPLFMIRKG